ncbi:PadR family transcriptional regulator [Agromyces seonyuensis]|uniref:PadR family transcriptional regulator n=1 Tax=Agromyces seonyuensis TaxID=2662446 RepID=A0A6I4NXT1_9MICO|nr:PadR family transcriptional regulator [Agromyces seonyuensis]MWB97325.1 PadR family transcriptional regulator [Agromyces seonyuensis]
MSARSPTGATEAKMSVRNSLLAILSQGACYGYQLKSEFERRTGGGRRLNVGQVYATLERLERDGLVERSDADPEGRAFFVATPAGRREAADWLAGETSNGEEMLDGLAEKLALALTLVGVDRGRLLDRHRVAVETALAGARSSRDGVVDPNETEGLAALVVADARVARLEGVLEWLDRLEVRLRSAADGHAPAPLPIHGESPRRGRPRKASSTAA